jgi:hypothetical protein
MSEGSKESKEQSEIPLKPTWKFPDLNNAVAAMLENEGLSSEALDMRNQKTVKSVPEPMLEEVTLPAIEKPVIHKGWTSGGNKK